jgi:hypothetical protein
VSFSLFFFYALSAFGQVSNAPAKENNLYSMALFASLKEMDKSWGYIQDSYGNREQTNYHHMLIFKNSEITDNLPTRSGDYQVEYLDIQAMIDRYKSIRKEFAVVEIHPIYNEGARLRIQISVSWFMYRKKRMNLAFSDWSDVEFLYDCEKHTYIISSVKLGGI